MDTSGTRCLPQAEGKRYIPAGRMRVPNNVQHRDLAGSHEVQHWKVSGV